MKTARQTDAGKPDYNLKSGTQPESVFATTQWTRVLAAKGESSEAQAALSDLCAAYYAPVFAFIRRDARDEDAARDLTQEFFARLLARHGFATVEPDRGSFRSFLLGAVKHFLADMRDHARAAKRGGGQTPLPLAPGTDTSPGLDPPDPSAPEPERLFDRQWAFTLLERALAALASEHAATGKAAQFAVLKPWLTGDMASLSQAVAAARLGMNEGAVKVAVHRLRRRFRELVKREIAQTTSDPSQIQEELRYLVEVLD